MKPRYFHIYFYDDETKTFNVDGPAIDDAFPSKKTLELQQQGKKVRIFTSRHFDHPEKLPSIQSLIRIGIEGYKHDPNLKW